MRPIGKTYEQLQKFISAVKNGKKEVLIGKDYVCMDKKTYNKLANPIEPMVNKSVPPCEALLAEEDKALIISVLAGEKSRYTYLLKNGIPLGDVEHKNMQNDIDRMKAIINKLC